MVDSTRHDSEFAFGERKNMRSNENHQPGRQVTSLPAKLKGSKDFPNIRGSKDSPVCGINGGGVKEITTKKLKRQSKRKRSKNSSNEIVNEENNNGSEEEIRNNNDKKINLTLQPLDEVSSATNRYVVRRKLGEGGFGAVYMVKAKEKPKSCATKIFALKTEARGPKSPDRLKIEVAVLTALVGCDEKYRERFAMMIDRGQTKDFVFIVMMLVGPSLQIIRDNILHKEFSPSTSLRIALESLESIKILHSEIGYIHRDIKPGNFTVGNNKNFTKIILIDFGIARKIMTKDNVLRLPRKEVKFLGTVRYASRRCHRNEEQGRQGDIESWFYMICDCYNQAVLPWRRVREKDLVFALKNDLRENDGNQKCFVEQLPKEFRDIMLYNDKLGYEDIPDYEKLKSFIEQAAKGLNIDLTQKYDWEYLGPPPGQDTDDEVG